MVPMVLENAGCTAIALGWPTKEEGTAGVREKEIKEERDRHTESTNRHGSPARRPVNSTASKRLTCLHERSGWSADRRNPGSYIMARIPTGRRSYFAAPQCRAAPVHTCSLTTFLALSRWGKRAPRTNHKTWDRRKRSAGWLRGERIRGRENRRTTRVDGIESRFVLEESRKDPSLSRLSYRVASADAEFPRGRARDRLWHTYMYLRALPERRTRHHGNVRPSR